MNDFENECLNICSEFEKYIYNGNYSNKFTISYLQSFIPRGNPNKNGITQEFLEDNLIKKIANILNVKIISVVKTKDDFYEPVFEVLMDYNYLKKIKMICEFIFQFNNMDIELTIDFIDK